MKSTALTVAAAVLGMAPASVIGGTKTFNVSSGNWSNSNNWSPTGVPTEADDVIIPTSTTLCTVDISTAVADTIVVETGAVVNISVSCKLTLDNDSSSGSTVDGQIFLDSSGNSAPPILAFIDQSHVVDGDGRIWGDNSGCVILIGTGITLTSQLAAADEGIRGSLTIMGVRVGGSTGTFINEGLVESTGLLVLHADTIIDDIDGAIWRAKECGPVLRFDRQALGLEGDFIVECGATLRFNASIKTCGDLSSYAGEIDVNNSATFKYVGFSTPGECDEPGSGGSGTCNDPKTVSADSGFCCVCR